MYVCIASIYLNCTVSKGVVLKKFCIICLQINAKFKLYLHFLIKKTLKPIP